MEVGDRKGYSILLLLLLLLLRTFSAIISFSMDRITPPFPTR